MKRIKISRLRDSFHEFLIMSIIGIGVSLPVIIFNVADILSKVNIVYVLDVSVFSGVY